MTSGQSSKRYTKIQEFAAHAGAVNCLKIGRKSSGVLVTGGEDKKVNVWALGRAAPVMSLPGHQSPVECVNFDSQEEIVAAGATNGTVKLWDLEQQKVIRSFTGHRSNVLGLDFTRQGNYLASGSLDTNLKLWDLRGKVCLHTLKGHTKGVTHVKFSPDAKWVISGSQNGEVKLWDLSTGRVLHDLKPHDNAVTGIEFHPRELLLATSSLDKTVRFWDLDNGEVVDTAGPEATGVRAIRFHPDGRYLFSAVQDGLKAWSWEPSVLQGIVDIPWTKISEISIYKNRVLGCSYNLNMVGVWMSEMTNLLPDEEPADVSQDAATDNDVPGMNGSEPEGPEPPVVDFPARRWSQSDVTVSDPAQAIKVVAGDRPSPAIATSDPPLRRPNRVASLNSRGEASIVSAGTPSSASKPRMVSVGVVVGDSLGKDEVGPGQLRAQAAAAAAAEREREREKAAAAAAAQAAAQAAAMERLSKPQRRPRTSSENGSGQAGSAYFPTVEILVGPQPKSAGQDAGDVRRPGSGLRDRADMGIGRFPFDDVGPSSQPVIPPRRKTPTADHSSQPPLSSYLPPPSYDTPPSSTSDTRMRNVRGPSPDPWAPASPSSSHQDDLKVIASIMSQRSHAHQTASSRLACLQLCRNFWQRRDIRGLFAAVRRAGDPQISVDIFDALRTHREVFTLDTLQEMLPLVEALLTSAPKHVGAGLDVLSLMLRHYGQTIRDTCGHASSVGVDLKFEERREKCMVARMSLQSLMMRLGTLSRDSGPHGRKAEDIKSQIQQL